MTGFAGLSKPRRSVGGSFKPGIALSAATAFGNDEGFFGLGEVFQKIIGFRIFDERSRRDFDDEVGTVFTGFTPAQAVAAVFGFELPLKSEWI